MQSHIRKMHACLAVTCHLHFWQNDRDLLRATSAVTRGWNGYRNKSQHRKLTQDVKHHVYYYFWPRRRKFSRRSCRDSNPRPFNHESGAPLTTELSPPRFPSFRTSPVRVLENCFCGIVRERQYNRTLNPWFVSQLWSYFCTQTARPWFCFSTLKLPLHAACVPQQSSAAVWKSRGTFWAPVPNKPTVSVDVTQHFNNNNNVPQLRTTNCSSPVAPTAGSKCHSTPICLGV